MIERKKERRGREKERQEREGERKRGRKEKGRCRDNASANSQVSLFNGLRKKSLRENFCYDPETYIVLYKIDISTWN